jgi:hypothetical protein
MELAASELPYFLLNFAALRLYARPNFQISGRHPPQKLVFSPQNGIFS